MGRNARTRISIAVGIVSCALLMGCSAAKLTDMTSLSSALDLTDEQARVVRPNVERIAVAVEDYEADQEAYAEEISGRRAAGGRGGRGPGGDRDAGRAAMQERLQRLTAKRAAYQAVIDRAEAAIAAALDEDQREQFAGIDRPELALPDAPSRGAGRGGRADGGRRGSGGKAGGLGDGFR
ncbi:hypothetical protein CMK11_07265 [Candidatus Poribacteria bacterium]|nr:hypothetical protein [Candidatus Poribacteria bacterium]